jgi:hypothetical protein
MRFSNHSRKFKSALLSHQPPHRRRIWGVENQDRLIRPAVTSHEFVLERSDGRRRGNAPDGRSGSCRCPVERRRPHAVGRRGEKREAGHYILARCPSRTEAVLAHFPPLIFSNWPWRPSFLFSLLGPWKSVIFVQIPKICLASIAVATYCMGLPGNAKRNKGDLSYNSTHVVIIAIAYMFNTRIFFANKYTTSC